jgi:hypothetical protein
LGASDVSLRRWVQEEKAARGERPGGLIRDERDQLALRPRIAWLSEPLAAGAALTARPREQKPAMLLTVPSVASSGDRRNGHTGPDLRDDSRFNTNEPNLVDIHLDIKPGSLGAEWRR